MVTVTIDGKTSPFPKGTNVLEAAQRRSAPTSATSATTRACRRRACAGSAWSRSRGSRSWSRPATRRSPTRWRSRRDRRSALDARQQMLEFTLVNHPIDCPICDKAGECTLQKLYFDWDAQARAQRRHQGPEGQGRRPRPAHRARPGALHPVHALHPRLRRGRRRRTSSRWRNRGDHEVLTTAPGQQARQPVLAQHRRRLPGRRADLEGLPLHDARVGALRDAVGLHRLRDRLQHRGPPRRAARSSASCRATTRTSTSTGCATRVASPTSELHDAAPRRRRCRAACPPTGTARSTTRRKRLRAALDASARQVGVVFNAQPTNEDHYALARLAFDHLRRRQASTSPGAARAGSDDILRRADINPNTAGAMAIGAGRLRSAARPGQRPARRARSTRCSSSARDGVLRRGRRRAALPLDRLETLVVDRHAHATRVAAAAQRRAAAGRRGPRSTARSPTAWASCSACTPRSPPPGDALPGWEILSHLARKLGATMELRRRPRRSSHEAAAEAAVHEGRGLGAADAARAAPLRELARLTVTTFFSYGHTRLPSSVTALIKILLPDPRLRDAARVAAHVDGAPAVRDDAGPPRSEPRQHRLPSSASCSGASSTSSPTR